LTLIALLAVRFAALSDGQKFAGRKDAAVRLGSALCPKMLIGLEGGHVFLSEHLRSNPQAA
jgi:hypothetical protein